MLNKDEVLKRARERHTETGRVIKALKRAFNASPGSNLLIEFVKEMQGLPYGISEWSIDKKADCSEFWRVTYYIFFGFDIGSYTESQYENKRGKNIGTNIKNTRLGDLIYYNFKKSRNVSHVAGVIDKNRIAHTRSIANPLMFSKIDYSKNSIVGIKRFLTDLEVASLNIIGSVPNTIKYGDNNIYVGSYQRALMVLGFDVGKTKDDNIFGKNTLNAHNLFQTLHGLSETNHVDVATQAKIFDKLRGL